MDAQNSSPQASTKPAILKPMRVGQILDRSISKFGSMFSIQLVVMISILSGFETLGYYFEDLKEAKTINPAQTLVYLLVYIPSNIVAQTFLTLFVIMTAKSVWLEENEDSWDILAGMSLGLVFRVFHLYIVLAIRTMLYMLLLIIPGLVFACNSSLSIYAVLLERMSVSNAIKRSKQLMTFSPDASWYSFRHPWMRLFAIGLVGTLISAFPSMLIGYGEFTRQSGPLNIMPYILQFVGYFSVHAVSLIGSLAMLGFYFDLRIRSEGIDLQKQLSELAADANSVPTS